MNQKTTIIQPVSFEPTGTSVTAGTTVPRLRRIVLLSVFVVGLLMLGFLLLSRAVYFELFPEEARVEINSGFSVFLTGRHLMIRGDYDINVTAEGYHEMTETITVGEASSQTFTFSMQKLPGHIEIMVAGQLPADVWLDEAAMAITSAEQVEWPVTINDVEPGDHQLRVIAEGYVPWEEQVHVEGMDTTEMVSIDLVPDTASLEITSIPPGASVLDGGRELGTTPFSGRLDTGARQLALSLPGYRAWQQEVIAQAGEEISFQEVVLVQSDGQVMIRSNPGGAAVTLDGTYQGVTPIQVEVSPGKAHALTLFKEGYQALERSITAQLSSYSEMTLKLEPNLVDVTIRATPADAILVIDGQPRGLANQTVKLSTRRHKIVISKPGFIDFETEINPENGVERLVEAILLNAEEAKWAGITPTAISAGGQGLILFRPEQPFMMGAPRRERGRQANEVIRKIMLSRAFYLSEKLVTNTQYRQYSADHNSGRVDTVSLDKSDHPVVNVSWEDAAKYCNWLSRKEGLDPFYMESNGQISGINEESLGYRLPTEAEWSWAARYNEAGELLSNGRFAWGDALPPVPDSGNFADEAALRFIANIIRDYRDNFSTTAPVGSFPANPNGLYDMQGNVAEWVHDFYEVKVTTASRAETDPVGPGKGRYHVIRGSGWKHASLTELRSTFRDYTDTLRNDTGFRIARWVE